MKGLVSREPVSSRAEGQPVFAADDARMVRHGVGVIVTREDGYDQSAQNYPDNFNARIPVVVHGQYASQLDPIPDSEFSSVGKPATHARAFTQKFLSLSLPQWLSVDGWNAEDGFVAKWVRSNVVSVPRGAHTALVDRANVGRAESSPYGDLYSVLGVSPVTIDDLYQG